METWPTAEQRNTTCCESDCDEDAILSRYWFQNDKAYFFCGEHDPIEDEKREVFWKGSA